MLGKCKLRFSEPTHLSGLSPVPMRSFKKAPMHREAAVWNVPATLLLAWQNTDVQVLPWCARQTQVHEKCPFSFPSRVVWGRASIAESRFCLLLFLVFDQEAGIILPKQENYSSCLHSFPIYDSRPLALLTHTSPRLKLKMNGAALCLILTQLTLSLLMF